MSAQVVSPFTTTTAAADSTDRAEGADRADRAEITARLLLKAHNAGSVTRRREIEDEIICVNMPVAQAIARRYANRGISSDDLEQVAYLGLVYAVRHFDLTRDTNFLSYAVPTIRGQLRKHFRDKGWTIRPTRRVQELQPRIREAHEVLGQKLGHSPRPADVAAYLGVNLDDVLEALASEGCFHPASLDTPVGDGESVPLGELLDSHETTGFDEVETRVLLAPAIRCLSDRDREILRLRFFEQCTQAEIGEQIGVTQMQVSRLLTRILQQLRNRIRDESTV